MKELIKIQTELSVPKNQFNKFGGYKYRSQEDILEAVKSLLKGTNCYLVVSDEIVEIGGRFYVKATATLTNSQKESVSNTAYARETAEQKGMNEAQITGSASSYARKYCLNGLFCIDDTKDPDTTNTHGKNNDKKPVSNNEKEKIIQVEKIESLLLQNKDNFTPDIRQRLKNKIFEQSTVNKDFLNKKAVTTLSGLADMLEELLDELNKKKTNQEMIDCITNYGKQDLNFGGEYE